MNTKERMNAKERWAHAWLAEHNLTRAYNDGDEKAIEKVARAQLGEKEADTLMRYLFPRTSLSKITISLAANAGVKRRMRERRMDKIEGDHLATTPPKVTRRAAANKLSRHLEIDPHLPIRAKEPEDSEIVEESLSNEVIFNPSTQTTRYSASREARRNLERRMPGYKVDVIYGSGEGILRFYARTKLIVGQDEQKEVLIDVEGLASPMDMAIHKVEVTCDGKTYSIDPADNAMSPEEAVEMLSRIAKNVVRQKCQA